MRKYVGLGVMVLVLLMVVGGPAAAQSSAPFIQYFDADRLTFVIERADGTESRDFLAVSVPPIAEGRPNLDVAVSGPGWSPSGEWFAVTTTFSDASGFTASSTDIVGVDGATRRVALDGLAIEQLAWSSVGDLLLATVNAGPGAINLELVIVNTPADTILAQTSVTPDATGSSYEAFWANEVAVVQLVGPTGQTSITSLNANTAVANQFAYTDFLGISRATGDHIVLIEQTIVYVPINGTPNQFTQPLTVVDSVAFHPTLPVALLQSLEGISQVSATELTTVAPGAQLNRGEVWSPDGTSALLVQNGELVRFNLSTQELAPTVLDVVANGSVAWSGNNLISVRPAGTGSSGLTVTLVTPTFNGVFETRNVNNVTPVFSPNNQYLAQVDMGVTLFNLSNRSRTTFGPDSRTYSVRPRGGEVEWHADGVYFLTLQAGGDVTYPSVFNLISANGRELPIECALDSELCVFWLPATVNVGRLPLGSDRSPAEPVRQVRHGWWAMYLDWSPDGSQLALGTSPQNPESELNDVVDIYDVQTLQIIGRYRAFNPFLQAVLWDDANVAYIAQRGASIQTPPATLATSPDGTLAAVYNNTLQLVNTGDNSVIADFGAFPAPGYPRSVSFNADGTLFAYGSQIIDTATGAPVAFLPVEAQAVAFSPDGTQLAATVGWDVRIYTLSSLLVGN